MEENTKTQQIVVVCTNCKAEYLPTENFRKCPYCGYIHDDDKIEIKTRIVE